MRLLSVEQRHLQRCCCLILLALPVLTVSSISQGFLEQIHGNTIRRSSPRMLAGNTSEWNTLDGSPPLVIARGGSSGMFPDQSAPAYAFAAAFSLVSNTALMCDLQLTKDGRGMCRTGLNLDPSTDVSFKYPSLLKTYDVNGVSTTGFFSIDLSATQALDNLTAFQAAQQRSPSYNGMYRISTPEDVAVFANKTQFVWINVEYPSFFSQHKLEMSSYVITLMAQSQVDFISSPEIAFLKAVKTGAPNTTARLVFKFGAKDALEPSTNVTYGTLLTTLKTIATYASGIMVPKEYIWPVDNTTRYLGTESTLITDAHTAGLAIYASGFINDPPLPVYNYSFDSVREYLQYIPSTLSNVDGFVTDFPDTASEALACFRSTPTARVAGAKPWVISHNGDSGNFPGCTLLSYEGAVRGGASHIDCPVQMTSDGVPICRESPNLLISTDVASHSNLSPRISTISQLQGKGLYSFNMTWAETQTLKATMYSPESDHGVKRNPAYTKESIITLTDFLNYAATNTTAGILIDIQNGYFLETEIGLNVVGSVLASLNEAGLNMSNRVVIQSEDSAILQRIKQSSNYTLIFRVTTPDVVVTKTEVAEVKALTDFVTLPRGLIQVTSAGFLWNMTDVVDQFRAQNVSVFVSYLRNEFVAIPFDYEADPIQELNTFVQVYKVDGLITDFPSTAAAYLGNTCLDLRTQATAALPYVINLVIPGQLLINLPPNIPELPPRSTNRLNVSNGELALPPTLSPLPSPTTPPSSTPAKSPAPSASAAFCWGEPNVFVLLLASALSLVLSNCQ